MGDKLELSLKTYIELVMANNTDIAIQKLTIDMGKNAIMRAFAPFDPMATGRFNSTRTKSVATQTLDGRATLSSPCSQPATFGYSQMLQNGTQYNVNFGAIKSTTNSSFATLNPSLSQQLRSQLYPAAAEESRRLHQSHLRLAGAEAACAKPNTT